MNKFFIVLVGSLIVLMSFSACGALPFSGQPEPTATRRAPRPTFTPKAQATPTEEVEPTQEIIPTDEPEPTDEPLPPTDVPVTEAPQVQPTRPPAPPPQPTQPPEPPPPAAPAFTIVATDKFLCEQEGIFEVAVSVKRQRESVEGVYFAALDQGGRLLTDGAGKPLVTATYPVSQSTAGNCKLSGSFESPVINNGKLDVTDPVRAESLSTVVIRFVKSETDMTPLSADIPINFGTGGRYWIYTQFQ